MNTRILKQAGVHSPAPWTKHQTETRIAIKSGKRTTVCYININPQEDYDAALILQAPELLKLAHVLQCLTASPRFQTMTVMAVVAELQNNGLWTEPGPVIALATEPQS